MEIKAEIVKNLRDKTGAGFMDCKAALSESKGNVEKAIEILRIKGITRAEKRSARVTKEGLVHSYIHPGSRIGVLVEVNCETDFVARNEDFVGFVKDLAMHIAAANPSFMTKDEVPAEVIEKEKIIFEEQAKKDGKPEKAIPKIIEGRVKKYYEDSCLMNQPFVKDEKQTISTLLQERITKIGEKISVKRFARFQLGEGTE